MSNLFSAHTVNADYFFFFKLLRRNFSIFFWVGRRQFCTYSTLYDQYTSKGGRCSITANHISIKKNFRENFGQQKDFSIRQYACVATALFLYLEIFSLVEWVQNVVSGSQLYSIVKRMAQQFGEKMTNPNSFFGGKFTREIFIKL